MANGVEALAAAKADPPSLILLDIMMAPINGWEFLEKLRATTGLETIPVILFTASPTVDEVVKQLNDNNLGVLRKPVSITELKAGLEHFLGK